jgi:hypothetical protein
VASDELVGRMRQATWMQVEGMEGALPLSIERRVLLILRREGEQCRFVLKDGQRLRLVAARHACVRSRPFVRTRYSVL